MIFFLVTYEENHVICMARNREYAKSKASVFLRGDPDQYIVEPMTREGETVYLDITVKG